MIAGSRVGRLSPSFVLAVFLGAAMLLVVLAYAREVEQVARNLRGWVPGWVPGSSSQRGRPTVPPMLSTAERVISLPLITKGYPPSLRSHLPLVGRGVPRLNDRVGFCAAYTDIASYPSLDRLGAGFYINYAAEPQPVRPAGMEFVQTVRIHQKTQCYPRRLRNRSPEGEECTDGLPCPYVQPYTYTVSTSPGAIVSIAQQNPGALWLVGNEPDRYDWGRLCKWGPGGDFAPVTEGGQDEALPEVYAQAYYDIYHQIKSADPTARVGNAGIIQATPSRMQYITKVWDYYRSHYGQDMPVDVWNVHNFILKERCDEYGADVPPGYDSCRGTVYSDQDTDNMPIFDGQIRAFRRWMKDRGQQDKPLIVSEYGFLYHHILDADRDKAQARVTSFMLKTFDYFMNTSDRDLGCPGDDYRLVQRWAWYSLDDDGFNPYNFLYSRKTQQTTPLGEAFGNWALTH